MKNMLKNEECDEDYRIKNGMKNINEEYDEECT